MRFRYVEKSKLNLVPQHSGVYVLSQNKEILYIGKAANLRERIKSHFHKSSYRDNLFVDKVTRVGWLQTQSDIDALLLESQLIKQKKPRYNVMWRDDKKYFYVAITKEKLPRVFLTHQPAMKLPSATPGRASLCRARPKGSHMATNVARPPKTTQVVLGPFVDGKAIKHVLRLLRRAFPYYTQKKHSRLPCSWCHLGLCPGPNPNPKAYTRNIKNLAAVLQGKKTSVLKNLKQEMSKASQEQRFEEAGKLRDQVFALENVARHSLALGKEPRPLPKPWRNFKRIEAYDISNIQGKFATGSMVTFLKGKPAKEWYRKFKIHITGKPNDFAMMEEVISRRLKHPEWPYPDLMIIDGGKPQLSAALKALEGYKIQVAALAKKHNELFSPKRSKPLLLKNLPQDVSNLLLHIRDEAHRFAVTYHRKLRRVDLFSQN
ncbi:MAG: excinuclease ABC subunit C [Parcubacteria group bacterium Greene1014_47]|nr:MAG: excinuclease ABC subunit C [Parcubacteria group bacterium Greene1014_47]